MKKSDTQLLVTAIIWAGITIAVAISTEHYLYLMIFGCILSLGSVKKIWRLIKKLTLFLYYNNGNVETYKIVSLQVINKKPILM